MPGEALFRSAITAATLGDVLPTPILTAVTDAYTGAAHLITDAAATGRPAGSYIAVCGQPMLAGSLTAPMGRPCESCTRGSW